MNKHYIGKVAEIECLNDQVFRIQIIIDKLPPIVSGQFLNVKIPGGKFLLRRPLGICSFNTGNNTIDFCFQVRGQGTAELALIKKGDELDVLLPLGNGFPDSNGKKVMLIGGGIGVFPLLTCAKDAYGFFGFRDEKSVLLADEFRNLCKETHILTQGFITDLARSEFDRIKPDMIFACGPNPMFKALQKTFADIDIPIYVSLEERMACGFGACLCCNTRLSSSDGSGTITAPRVCCEGPVFLLKEVIL